MTYEQKQEELIEMAVDFDDAGVSMPDTFTDLLLRVVLGYDQDEIDYNDNF